MLSHILDILKFAAVLEGDVGMGSRLNMVYFMGMVCIKIINPYI